MQLFLLLLIQYLWQSHLYRSRLVGHTEPRLIFFALPRSACSLASNFLSTDWLERKTTPVTFFYKFSVNCDALQPSPHLIIV